MGCMRAGSGAHCSPAPSGMARGRCHEHHPRCGRHVPDNPQTTRSSCSNLLYSLTYSAVSHGTSPRSALLRVRSWVGVMPALQTAALHPLASHIYVLLATCRRSSKVKKRVCTGGYLRPCLPGRRLPDPAQRSDPPGRGTCMGPWRLNLLRLWGWRLPAGCYLLCCGHTGMQSCVYCMLVNGLVSDLVAWTLLGLTGSDHGS